MKSESKSNNFSLEQTRASKKRKVVIASVDIEEQARDIAEEKMTASKGEIKGIRGFFKKIWKHNLAHEYYRQKEIAKARREIQQSGNLYVGEKGEKADHDSAMKAVVERFESEYDKELLRKGEDKRILKEENPEEKTAKDTVKDLVRKYATGNLTDEQFDLEKNNLFEKELGGIKDKGKTLAQRSLLYADNLLEIAKQVKADIAHGKGLNALDLDFDVVVGKAKAGVETQAQYNAVDKIVEKIQRSFFGRFVNEATIASAVAIAYGVGIKGTMSTAQRAAKWVGPLGLGLSAGIGGAVAGIRENKRFKEERAQHIREMAKGKGIEAGSIRREEMEKFRYETKNANELIANLLSALTNLKSNPSGEHLGEVLKHINEIDARISFSEREKIDLISFSDAKKVEQERTRMYISAAEAKVFLKKNTSQNWTALYKDDAGLTDYLSQIKETKIQEDFKREKTLKDEAFAKMKKKKVAGAVMKGVIIGVGVGMIAQEVQAYLGGSHVDAEHLPQTFTQHIEGSEQMVNIDTKDYIKNHEDLFSEIKRGHWADNDSLRPDKNELKLWWGGEKGTGLDSDGNYVFNVKNMAPGGSSHGGANWNPQELMREGKMKMLVSLSQDTQNQVVEIPIDANGNAIIDPNSEIGKLAFQNINGHAKFIGRFAEVAVMGENKGGADYVDILATHKGGGIENVMETIKKPAYDIENVIPGKSPSDYDVNWPYAIPIAGRRPLEKLGERKENNEGEERKKFELFRDFLVKVMDKKQQSLKDNEKEREKYQLARVAMLHTLYKVENYKDLNAANLAEGDKKFLELTRKLWTELTVHEKPDLDANSCLKLMELAGVNVNNINFVPKGGTADSGIIMDTSEKQHGVIAEEGGKRLIIDHHGKESDRTTSATKFVYEALLEMGLLQKEEYLDKFVEFVTKCDNFNFTPSEMKQVYPNYFKNLFGLSAKMKIEDILELFKNGVNPMSDLSDDYLKSHEYFDPRNGGSYKLLTELAKHMGDQMEKGKEALKKIEKTGFVVDTGSNRFGKILIDTKKKIDKGRYYTRVDGDNNSNQLEVFLKGYGGYLIWSPSEKSFALYTEKKMDDRLIPGGFSQGKNVRGHMWMKPQNDQGELTITLEEIFSKLKGRDFKIEGELQKLLKLDEGGKKMLNLLDEGKLTEDALKKTAIEANVPLRKLLTEMMMQRAEVNRKFLKEIDKIKKMPPAQTKSIDPNKIAINLFLEYQKIKLASQPAAPLVAPTQPVAPIGQVTEPENVIDVEKEKQEKMSNSVKKLSGLFSSFELSYDAIREEAKKSQVSPSELAIQFIQGNPELRVEYEKRLSSIPAAERNEKEIEESAMVIILEDENNKIKEKIKENSREISAATNDNEKQKLENEGENLEDKLGDIGQDLIPLKISQKIF